jgi:hypothetical protein
MNHHQIESIIKTDWELDEQERLIIRLLMYMYNVSEVQARNKIIALKRGE